MRSLLKSAPQTVHLLRRSFSSSSVFLNDIDPSELNMSRQDEISSGILKKVNDLVQRHKLISDKFDADQKVVDFEHPNDLFSLLPLEISSGGCSDEELERIR